jgi:hypothetical protein
MKLVRQYISEEHINEVLEEKNGEKAYYIEGVFLQGNKKNRNGRMYPTNVLSEKVREYTEGYIVKKRSFGELGHPNTPSLNLERVSHIIVEIRQEGDNFRGRAKILNTPYGQIVRNFIDEGARLGVSSRGLGTVESKNGVMEVQSDFRLSTVDIVADPSAPDAFVDGIMESYEWYYENGILKAQEIDTIRKTIHEATSVELQEKKIEVFRRFIQNL